MRSYGLTPSVSGSIAQALGSAARSLLTPYGQMFSNPKVHDHKVGLEPPFFPFHIPCPFTPERIEAEVVAKLEYASRDSGSRVGYSTMRLWFSESDKPPDPAEIWHELGFMREAASMLLAFGNESRIQQILHAPTTYSPALTSVLSSKMPHVQC